MDNYLEKVKLIKELLKPENMKVLENKLPEILRDKDFYKFGLLEDIINSLKITQDGQKAILENFEELLNNAYEDEAFYLVKAVLDIKDGQKMIVDNISKIYKKLDVEEIPEFIELLEEKEQNRIKEENSYAYELFEKELIDEDTLGSIIKSQMNDFVKIMMYEISNGKPLKRLSRGTYSVVIETNGYVVKMGETREKFEIPYHPNIIQPLLREEVKDNDGKTVFVTEIQPKVDTKSVNAKHIEYLKQKFKEAGLKYRDFGTDNEESNVGILIKPNKRYLSKGAGGIVDSGVDEREAKPGEPVIIDTDSIERE